MIITPLKTKIFLPPKGDLLALINEGLSGRKLKEKSIFVVTSKVVAISQGRCIKIGSVEKDELVKKESYMYLDREEVPNKYVMLTIKNNILIPTAGIDESNGNGYYILWPSKPFDVAKQIQKFLKSKFSLQNLGVIITDSHTMPLRWGVTGIAVSYYGFNPLRDYRGSKDIFGREMKISQANIADAIAAAAVLLMGEGNEQTPMAIVEDTDFINFVDLDTKNPDALAIDKATDIYSPLVNSVNWKKGGSGI